EQAPPQVTASAVLPKSPTPPPPNAFIPPPPIPREPVPAAQPEFVPSSSKSTDTQAVPRKSATPWILIGVIVAVVFGGAILLVIALAFQQPKTPAEQASATATPTTQLAEATPQATSSPARVAKVKQKASSQALHQSKAATPSGEGE